MPSNNPSFDRMLADEDRQQHVELNAQATLAIDTNPDQYATQRKVAGYLGYPVAAVEALPEQTQREAKVRQLVDNAGRHPVLARRYTDADFAKLASDDHGALSAISDAIGATASYVLGARADGGLPEDFAASALKASRGAAGAFRATAEVIAPVLDPLERFPSIGGNPLRRLAEGFDMQAQVAGRKADAVAPLDPNAGVFESGVRSGVQSLGQNILMLPMALMNPTAGLTTMAAVPAGHAFVGARQNVSSQKALTALRRSSGSSEQ